MLKREKKVLHKPGHESLNCGGLLKNESLREMYNL